MKFQNLEIQTSKKEPNPWASKHQQANNQLRRITNKNQQRKSIARDFSFFGTCFPSISSKHKRKEKEQGNWTWSEQNLEIAKQSEREKRELPEKFRCPPARVTRRGEWRGRYYIEGAKGITLKLRFGGKVGPSKVGLVNAPSCVRLGSDPNGAEVKVHSARILSSCPCLFVDPLTYLLFFSPPFPLFFSFHFLLLRLLMVLQFVVVP